MQKFSGLTVAKPYLNQQMHCNVQFNDTLIVTFNEKSYKKWWKDVNQNIPRKIPTKSKKVNIVVDIWIPSTKKRLYQWIKWNGMEFDDITIIIKLNLISHGSDYENTMHVVQLSGNQLLYSWLQATASKSCSVIRIRWNSIRRCVFLLCNWEELKYDNLTVIQIGIVFIDSLFIIASYSSFWV